MEKKSTSFTNIKGQSDPTKPLVFYINNLRNILSLLLLLCIVHAVGAQSQDSSGCTVSRHLILNCSGRNLSEFPEVGPEVVRGNVELFLLEENLISQITKGLLTGYDHLEELFLSKNSLRHLENGTFLEVPSLKKLDLSRNALFAIESGAFNGLENLEEIYLEHNDIVFLPDGVFTELRGLKVINLRSNPLGDRSISKYTFRNLTRLEVIDMSRTLLTTLPNDLFQGCNNLKRVYLHKTFLISVNMIHWPNAPYEIVDLRYSPLVNITNVPKELTTLKASLDEVQCTCENERAILLILGGQNIASHCQDLRCNSPTVKSMATVVAPSHMGVGPGRVSSDVTCSSTSESVYTLMSEQIYLLLMICYGMSALVVRH